MERPDLELVMASKRGNREAFEELVGRYRSRMVRYAWRRLGSIEDAEEICQDAFLVAYLQIDRQDPAYPFVAWLYAIVKYRVMHVRRERAIRRAYGIVSIDEPNPVTERPFEIPDRRPTALERMLARERKRWLKVYMLCLPKRQRAVVARVLKGQTVYSAARDIGIPTRLAKRRVKGARRTLRRNILYRFTLDDPSARQAAVSTATYAQGWGIGQRGRMRPVSEALEAQRW